MPNEISKIELPDGAVYDIKDSAARVQADWKSTVVNDLDYIKNKPQVIAGTGTNAVVIGNTTASRASGTSAVAEGNGSASGTRSHAEGWGTKATNSYSHVEGYFSQATGYGSHVEGGYDSQNEFMTITVSGAASAKSYTITDKSRSTYPDIDPEHCIGVVGTSIYYVKSMDLDNSTIEFTSTLSTSEVTDLEVKLFYVSIGKGRLSHAEGTSLSSGSCGHAEGEGTESSGRASHTEGLETYATGTAAHAEGSATYANGVGSHSEGSATWATGTCSHTEGNYTRATKQASHAEGFSTEASGDYSHAEGISTIAVGKSSHAEGGVATASGSYAHAEGNYAIADGENAHAEGKNAAALGLNSHAEGGTNIDSTYTIYITGSSNVLQYEYTTTDSYAPTYCNLAYDYDSGIFVRVISMDTSVTPNLISFEKTIDKDNAVDNKKLTLVYTSIASGTNSHAEGA